MPNRTVVESKTDPRTCELHGNEAIDTVTGKPIVYADNLLTFFRSEVALTAEEITQAKALDALHPLERAAKGRDAWNLWVQAYKRNRWCVYEELTDRVYVRLREEDDEEEFEDGDFNFEVGIDFRLGIIPKGKSYVIDEADEIDFNSFHFPCSTVFDSLTFANHVEFSSSEFQSRAEFEGTTFKKTANFGKAVFAGGVYFNSARFQGFVNFPETKFLSETVFWRATFKGWAFFQDSVFTKGASFHDVIWLSEANFSDCVFKGEVHYKDATFASYAYFTRTKFEASANYFRTVFFSHAWWHGARFTRSVNFEQSQYLFGAEFTDCDFMRPVSFDFAWFGKDENTPKPVMVYDNWPKKIRTAYDDWSMDERNNVDDQVDGKVLNETVPDFKLAYFNSQPNFELTHIPLPSNAYSNQGAISKMRRLRELGAVFSKA